MTSKLLFAFLFLALLALVVDAQEKKKPDTTNEIDECIKKYQCAPDDTKCRAACAGDPSPGRDVAIETHDCYEECYNKHLPKDVPGYTTCTNDCKTKVYQEGVTTPGSPAPSMAQQNDDKETSSGDDSKDSDNKESSDGDAKETDGKGDDKNDSSDASLSSKSVLVYVFAAVLACAAFTAGL